MNCNMDIVFYNRIIIPTKGFEGKMKNEKFIVVDSRCLRNLKFAFITSLFCGNDKEMY